LHHGKASIIAQNKFWLEVKPTKYESIAKFTGKKVIRKRNNLNINLQPNAGMNQFLAG